MDTAEHREVQALLPWFVTGRLETAERARVQAHLDACEACRADARTEAQLEREVARLPLDVERGWADMQRRMAAEAVAAPAPPPPGARLAAGWLGWGVAAALAVTVGVSWRPDTRPAAPADAYRALGAAPAPDAAVGNVVVVFLPETTERRMRAALKAAQARLTDGPTAANGYVLHVARARRAAALAALRADPAVVVAEPLDPGTRP